MEKHINKVKLFSGRGSRYLSEKIAEEFGLPLGDATFSHYSDGEFQPSLNESVRGTDIFIIQSTFPPQENLIELCLMIDAAKRASAHKVVAVIPYYGLARQDRKDKPRVPIAAKMVADILTAVGADRVMTMDLHAPQIQGFFSIPVDHLDASVIFIPYIQNLKLPRLKFAAPDIGASKRVRFFAQAMNVEMVICDKERKIANEVASMTVIGDVEGYDIVLVDDICDTANTLCKAAQLLKEKGARSVRAVCTHPVLSGSAYERIESSELDELVVTDTIPIKQIGKKIHVLSASKLFASAIRNVIDHSSISSLFSIEQSFQQKLNV
ncbi:MAG: ribose-phosphate pyrophosphokinase [Flavobacteriales bacterium]|nr:ribose-phosphate pyrophosphokinase [Flavobacteriales bacterium]